MKFELFNCSLVCGGKAHDSKATGVCRKPCGWGGAVWVFGSVTVLRWCCFTQTLSLSVHFCNSFWVANKPGFALSVQKDLVLGYKTHTKSSALLQPVEWCQNWLKEKYILCANTWNCWSNYPVTLHFYKLGLLGGLKLLLTIIFLTSFQLVVQKFVKKTQSTLSNHITEGTTHVIMKTGLLELGPQTLYWQAIQNFTFSLTNKQTGQQKF